MTVDQRHIVNRKQEAVFKLSEATSNNTPSSSKATPPKSPKHYHLRAKYSNAQDWGNVSFKPPQALVTMLITGVSTLPSDIPV